MDDCNIVTVGGSIEVSVQSGVSIGHPVRLHCKARLSSIPLGELTWSEGGILVTEEGNRAVVNRTGPFESDLIMYNISSFDLGEYTCSIKYRAGEVISGTAILDLEGESGSPVIEAVRLQHGQVYTVNCTEGEHLYTKRSAPGVLSFSSHSSNSFTIKMSSLENQCKVVCVSTEGKITKIAYVAADYEPIAFTSPTSQETRLPVPNFSSLTVKCAATGTPTPKLQWIKLPSNPLTDDSPYIQLTPGDNSISLYFRKYFQLFYGGLYVCRARNVWETVERRVHLDDGSSTPPRTQNYYGISMFNGTRSVAIGGTIKLICRAKVNPFVRTHAMIVRKASSNTRGTFATKFKSLTSHTYTRTIKNARMDDSGTYQCFIFSLRIGVTVTRELEVVVGDHL
jgi:hypothetical protein